MNPVRRESGTKGIVLRVGLFFWPLMLAGLWGTAWYLTGDVGMRDVIPADKTSLDIYLTVFGAGMIVAGALRIIGYGDGARQREAVIWIAAMICFGLGYGSRDQLADLYDRVRGNIYPSVALTTAQGEAQLRRHWDGHYRAEAKVNGVNLLMLVDTGASMVLIPFEEAHKLGINRDRLEFSLPVTTANGQSHVARVRLSSIKIGPIAVFDVEAAVARPGMLKTGLLGMSFLDRLDETSFRHGRLTLRN